MQETVKIGVLRLPSVVALVGLSRSAIYQMMDRGEFPQKILLAKRAVGWRRADIEAWLASRPVAGGKEGA